MKNWKIKFACLPILSVVAAPVGAQWNEVDRSLPYALEACGSVNFQLSRWETAVHFFDLVAKKNPEDAFSALWLAHSLTELGQRDRAIAACERAAKFPAVRASALLHLARNQAAGGDSKAALASLEEAARAQLVDTEGWLAKESSFKSIRSDARFKAVQKSLRPIQERIHDLSKANDFDGLVALFQANAVLVNSRKPETSDHVLAELKKYAPNVQKKNNKNEADRLRLIGRALDATVDKGRFGEYIESRLAWGPDEIKAEKKGWEVIKDLGYSTRSHRFDYVIRTADKLARDAASRGDLIQLYYARRSAFMCHDALRNYRQPRDGVSAKEEWRLGTQKTREALKLTRALGIISGVEKCFEYLASYETHQRAMNDREYDQIICEGMVVSNRVPPSRDIGMWENMWRERRNDGDK